MAIFVAAYTAFLLAICWLGLAVNFGIAKRLKSHEMVRLTKRVLAWLGGLEILTVGFAFWLWFFPSASVIYQREFGENSVAEVTKLRGADHSHADMRDIKLRFQATSLTIKSLVQTRNLQRISRADFKAPGRNSESAPQWWKPFFGARSWAFSREINDSSRHENTLLIYDPQSQTAYYSYFGVD